MVDVPAIQGPGLPPEPPSKKTDRSVDSDSFHKEMHKRVEKVSETDQEQKKKRKRKDEAEEEDAPNAANQGPTTPPDQVSPFSLVQGTKKTSPFDMQEGGKISPLASSQSMATPNAPSPMAPLSISSIDEMGDDSGMLEESAWIETTPSEPAPPAASYTPAPLESAAPAPSYTPAPSKETPPPPPPPVSETPRSPTPLPTPRAQDEKPVTPSDEKKKKTSQAGPPPGTPPLQKAAPKMPEKPPAAPVKEPGGAIALPTEEMQEPPVTAEEAEAMKDAEFDDTSGFYEHYVGEKEKGQKKEVKPKENAQQEEEEEVITPVTPLPSSAYIEKEKKQEEEVAALGMGGGSPSLELPPSLLETGPLGVSNPYANLHPQVMDLFDRMVGTMTVMSLSGISETVVTLDSPKFASSVFYGSQFIIQEYTSIAPREYNIQLNAASPQALALFQGNADDLMAAFQYGNYNFRVNRLETGILTRPLIRRKESPSGGGDGQKGSGNK